ncbi:hypothetical protein [Palleronia pelagia]|uniref:hypothetical protein n=1 Tax=Palleronia pelagia TaxID=387096 RepID=UPI001113A6A0|nr:hypothetical protein [Palleronia pelagia]
MAAAVITATTAPVMASLADGATLASGFTPGVYTSSVGTISSQVATYYLNGSPVAGTTTIGEGDTYYAIETVTNSEGNSQPFATAAQTLPVPLSIGTLANVTETQAAGGTVQVALSASGGTAPYSFSSNVGSVSGSILTLALDTVQTTAVTVTVTDDVGATAQDSFTFTVEAPAAPAPILDTASFDPATNTLSYTYSNSVTGFRLYAAAATASIAVNTGNLYNGTGGTGVLEYTNSPIGEGVTSDFTTAADGAVRIAICLIRESDGAVASNIIILTVDPLSIGASGGTLTGLAHQVTDTFGTENAQPYTVSGVPIGTAAANRWVVVMTTVGLQAATDVQLTIGGVAAQPLGTPQSSGALRMLAFKAAVPTGTTADIAWTDSQTTADPFFDIGHAVYTMLGEPVLHDEAFDDTPATNQWAVLIDVPEGGVLIGMSRDNFNSNLTTWTGLTEDADTGTRMVASGSASGLSAEIDRPVTVTSDGGATDFEDGFYVISLELAA